MDMSLNELIIILLGEVPKTFPKWSLKTISKNRDQANFFDLRP